MAHRFWRWLRRMPAPAPAYDEVTYLNHRAHRLLYGSFPRSGQPVADYLYDEAAQRQILQRLAAEGWRMTGLHQERDSADKPVYRAGFEHEAMHLYWHSVNRHSAPEVLVQGILAAIAFGREYIFMHPEQRQPTEHA